MTTAALPLRLFSAPAKRTGLGPDDRALLATYARDTWRSIAASADRGELPDDTLRLTESGWVASGLTSPTNIGAYLWSTVAAEDLRLISRIEADQRLGRTLAALARLERVHGFFFNWYNTRTGSKVLIWPGGVPVRPFLSTVDNGWLAAALMIVGNTWPEYRKITDALLAPMDFGFFYSPHRGANSGDNPGLLRGGYWPDDGTYTGFHYGMLNTEPRIASYIGIARGDLPAEHYYRMARAGPAPSAVLGSPTRIYAGVSVVEGSQKYLGRRVVPSWDGTMFEALMVPLFVPEAEWAPRSWGRNHPLYVQAQIEYGLLDARLGYWGLSAALDPVGNYSAFGVAGIAAGSFCNPAPIEPQGIVTPHASFLALPFAPREALANLRALTDEFPAYGPYGFFDTVDVVTGRVSDAVLVLDQGMILAALSQAIGGDVLRQGFCAGAIEETIRPLIAPERFEAGADPPSILRLARPAPWSADAAGFSNPSGPKALPGPSPSTKVRRRLRRSAE